MKSLLVVAGIVCVVALSSSAATRSPDDPLTNKIARLESTQRELLLAQRDLMQLLQRRLWNAPPRRVYVTPGYFEGDEVLTACARGYHLASYWEIREPSNFVYETRLGLTNADYQFGPPASKEAGVTGLWAWLDFGTVPDVTYNCNGWTGYAYHGYSASLGMANPASTFYPFNIQVNRCNMKAHVWCASDPQ